jgi:hypothetical protein
MSQKEEVADLIVEGRNREAYDLLREYWGLQSWDARERLIKDRKAPHKRPLPTEAKIDASHDRALATFTPPEELRRRYGIPT